MTKTGNTHARRALVEGAWAYRYPAKVSRHLQLRLEKLPKAIRASSWHKRRSSSAKGVASSGPKAKMPIKSSSPWPGHEVPACEPWPSRWPYHQKPKNGGVWIHKLSKFPPSLG